MNQQRLVSIEMHTKQFYFKQQWLNKTLIINPKQHKYCQYNLVQLYTEQIYYKKWNKVKYIKYIKKGPGLLNELGRWI